VPLDPEDDFNAPHDNPYDSEDTFEVLVRDRMNRNPLTYQSYPRAEPQEQLFVINRGKFWIRSGFFREALEDVDSESSDWSEQRPIILENHDPEDFEAYVRFVETESLDMPSDDDVDPLFPMLRLYVLADELGDFSLANLIINDVMKVSDRLNHAPSKKEIWFVWRTIEEFDHPLKRLFVDYQIHEAARSGLIFQDYEHIPFDYLNDVVLKYWDLAELEAERRREGRDDVSFGVACSGRGLCYYHQHDEDSYHLSCEELGLSTEQGGAGNGD
jgi:hypothetical protein